LDVPESEVVGAEIVERDRFSEPVAHFPPDSERMQQHLNGARGIPHSPVGHGDVVQGDGFAPQLLGLLLGMAAGSALYLWLTRRLRLTEADLVLGVVRRRLRR